MCVRERERERERFHMVSVVKTAGLATNLGTVESVGMATYSVEYTHHGKVQNLSEGTSLGQGTNCDTGGTLRDGVGSVEQLGTNCGTE